ncbi:ribonuclease M5 [Salimicrobium salexigens]|uniref:Ribonuclease M5 n=1 Tax=Salimicrobium salexigens TaxID=908941 RepID=A0ABY1KZG7_9BACI|nr:ribonuclease M5 [Salimicrobium salexigens]SIS97021.1 RNAse M5 [Salimicrobium salexigens]
MKVKEIIVVEGKDDTQKIKQAVVADTIETNGSAIGDDVLERIRHAYEKRGVIIFTDPDYPGKRIRHIVSEHVPGCKHAFLPKHTAIAKHDKGIGVEHASAEHIREALSAVYEVTEEEDDHLEKADLLPYGLVGGPGASARREKLGERLYIGHTNAKQLVRRLNMFRITKEEVEQVMREIIQEEKDEQ